MSERYSGLIAAVFTPMNADGSIAPDRAPAAVDHLKVDGVSAILICGSTGEGPLLTTEERKEIASAFVEAARGKLRAMVHVGHSAPVEARDLAEHAASIGAEAILYNAPFYFKPRSVEVLADCCAYVHKAAPHLPLYYYHIPALTGVSFRMREFLPVARERCPGMVGMKFTHEDLMDYRLCIEFDDGRYDMVFGRDEILLAALALGGKAATGSTYNYAAPLYRRIWSAFDSGDPAAARMEQGRSARMIDVMHRHGGSAAGKAIMRLIGVDMGPARLPMQTLEGPQLRALEEDLQRIGFFDWAL